MRTSALAAAVAAVVLPALAAPAAAQTDQLCLMCHSDVTLFAGLEDPTRMVVTQEDLAGSVHGALGLGCTFCHSGYTGFPHPDDTPPPNCGACHGQIQRDYGVGRHGYALERGEELAPTCVTCHGGHDIRRSTDPESPTYHAVAAQMCANCHGEAGLLTSDVVRLPQIYDTYAESVHGLAAGEGAASCTDCHGVHAMRGPLDPQSMINRMNVSATCAQCHEEISALYDMSIHGRALRAGLIDSPTCTDCHGEHHILSHDDPQAHTYAARLAEETCGECHDDPDIVAKYGLAGGVVGTYEDSYHGWAAKSDYERAATCVSCHGAHWVLPAADSASTIHPANVVETCQGCHPDADQEFATSYTHVTASIAANPINKWIRLVYLVLIVGTIGLMALHNLIVLNYYMTERRKQERQLGYVLRFDRIQLWQHMINGIAFIVLVITGFALRFPDAWWVQWLAAIGMSEPVRSNVHRIAAVVLLAVGASHLLYVLFVARGRTEMRAMLPGLRDVTEAADNLRFHLWRTKQHPRFGRYDYTQKAEYWALVWGTAVMAVTGFVLWFPVQATRFLPWWVVPASQTIHYYEAWLATLAILVWHFFFVIFHPDAYPMNWAWLTGRVPEAFVREHHARWYEEELAHPDARQVEKQGGDSTGVPSTSEASGSVSTKPD
jgi:formate dehydrogenase gamma subunit